MPIYEYQCQACHKPTSVLTMRVSEKVEARCRHCGGTRLRRLLSRFATPRSEEARMEALADPAHLGDLNENDPKSVARMMRKMGREMGEDFAGEDFSEAVDELERGGDLGGDDDGEL